MQPLCHSYEHFFLSQVHASPHPSHWPPCPPKYVSSYTSLPRTAAAAPAFECSRSALPSLSFTFERRDGMQCGPLAFRFSRPRRTTTTPLHTARGILSSCKQSSPLWGNIIAEVILEPLYAYNDSSPLRRNSIAEKFFVLSPSLTEVYLEGVKSELFTCQLRKLRRVVFVCPSQTQDKHV